MAVMDTDILVAFLRKDVNAKKKIESMVQLGIKLSTTSITAAELFKGAYKSRDEDAVKTVYELLVSMEVLDFGMEAANVAGKISSELEKGGRKIGSMDTMIAAIVISHGESIITRNERHFGRIPYLHPEKW
ncbi:MAG: type II toxin-antitoxin system VapC family toxin [Candidatus Aenigmarchaeota archaeon]|nr:type II toxin-antitoxin system VapC family toxin [Candidatus Aenigmarchaeota archaeon]